MKTIDHFHSGKISTGAGLRYCPKVLLHIHIYEIPQGRSSLDWQGKDMDRKVLCTGQFFQPLVLDAGPRQVNLCKKDTSRLKDLRVKQISPLLLFTWSQVKQAVHEQEGSGQSMRKAVTLLSISTLLLLIFYLLFSFTRFPSQSRGGRQPNIWISLSVCLGNATRLYHKVTSMGSSSRQIGPQSVGA